VTTSAGGGWRRLVVLSTALAATALLLLVRPLPASAEPTHLQPQGAAHVGFAADFPHLVDHEWSFRLGGFGGKAKGAALHHVPVILVHGNNVDAADWYPVRDDFRAAGWTDQEIWALSYNGLGANNGTAVTRMNPERDAEHTQMGWDGQVRVTNDDVNVADLYDFIKAVQAYTGSPRFSLAGHSLGVTLARKTLKVHPELREQLVAFVGIAGANHGTTFCPPGSEGNVVSCNEIAAGTQWLADLNGTAGADETYGATKWLTVYDGTGAGDPAFVGPTYAQSPRLEGATNKEYPNTYHNDLRIDAPIVADYRAFLEQAEKPYLDDLPSVVGEAAATDRPPVKVLAGSSAREPLAATGGQPLAASGLLALGAALLVRGGLIPTRRRRRSPRRAP
jgi:pimeloyl-ACP methyl ester carboxylesterase